MLFNSNSFLFIFLPIVLVGFYIAIRHLGLIYAQWWLAASSLAFYGWSNWRFISLLLGSIGVNFVIGRLLTSVSMKERYRTLLLPAGIVFNLSLLAYFKYGGFLDENVRALAGFGLGLADISLPVGISFYTFTQIAFLVDAAKGQAAEYDVKRYVLFVTFFPHLIAGPILHHREMMPQFSQLTRTEGFKNISVGIVLLAIGLAKKCLIADPLGAFASPIFSRAETNQDVHFFIAWAGTLAYTFQIYFDFSGYSDMAIGLARMFGVKFPANFDSPYKATSIVEFWRRWHMTLSRFLRDYIYIPLGGARQGSARRYLNVMLVMLIGGLWHGAAWTFVLWGGLHGFFLLLNHAWNESQLGGRIPRSISRTVGSLSWPMTFLAVTVAWVTFRATTIDAAFNLYHAMFLFSGVSIPAEAANFLSPILPTQWMSSIHFFAENSREQFYVGLLWISGAAAVAFFAPNSLQIAATLQPTTDIRKLRTAWLTTDSSRRSAFFARRIGRVTFSPFGGVICGLLIFLAVRAINAAAATEFLYFQF